MTRARYSQVSATALTTITSSTYTSDHGSPSTRGSIAFPSHGYSGHTNKAVVARKNSGATRAIGRVTGPSYITRHDVPSLPKPGRLGQTSTRMNSAPRSSQVGVGEPAPDFTLFDHNGQRVTLGELVRTRCVVLYFYPKDDTPGCTAEACSFRDSYEVFKAAGAEVVGISSDGVQAHEAFVAKYHLPFVLVSDPGGSVRARYGVKRSLGLVDGRVTFVIDREGVVRHVFSSQIRPKRHVDEALMIVKQIQR